MFYVQILLNFEFYNIKIIYVNMHYNMHLEMFFKNITKEHVLNYIFLQCIRK